MTKDQALRQAMDDLDRSIQNALNVIEQTKQALAQPETEPVAYWYQSRLGNGYFTDTKANSDPDWKETPLYTSLSKHEPMLWQPVETAPKETEVLVYGDGATHVARLVKNGWAIDDGGGLAYINTPTHWMPLPKPPTASRRTHDH